MMFGAPMALTRSRIVTPAACMLGHVGHDMELGNLAALHGDGADAGDAVQRRLQAVGRQLPEFASARGGLR